MQENFFDNKNILNLLFQAASEGIIVVDSRQIVVAANLAAEEMFGYKQGELLSQHLDRLVPKDYHHVHHKHVDQFIDNSEKRQMGHGRDLYGVRKDGSLFPVEAGLNPFEIDGEKYVMSLIIDITIRKETQRQIRELNTELEEKIELRTRELSESVEDLKNLNVELGEEINRRKEAEEKIKDALQKEKELNELKTKFLSLVSHEFKTPLSGILTSATLAEKYTKEEQQPKREKHLVTIRNKVHYLNNILNDFLSIERLDSGRGQYKFSKFRLKRLINEVIYNANITLKDGQEISYPKDIEDVELFMDEKILELILSNLLGNAIKYSPENTSIQFMVDFHDDLIVFKIKDQGRGIPKKDQKHIFERYFRAENALLDQGTGIGLNIAKTHLENLGGTIQFESEENKGTTFTIEVPMDKS
ncbi:PAS domain-containing sensor histidine kinase [Christiangramia sp. OXR-203]|uniref:histidine kinase n=1 Tax=uncultured Bacteroidota bacterium TaxID=152509 RepID=A0A1B0Z1S9_9BACT|nr:PAS domain-containing sensor histidine kinase [Christiangramia sp. OXR-203]ANO58147.1 histidine kinase [uncultured Bacteroidetes bacterium]WPY98690.1 PAS domain-containing sensor histidine kinase [Christiangramia sp. OXR-203]